MANTNGSDLEGVLQRSVPLCNCVEHYRRVIRFRQALLTLSDKQGEISEAQAIGMFVSFHVDATEGVIRLLGEDAKSMRERVPDSDFMWKWLGHIRLKAERGRPTRSDTYILVLCASALMFCPNAYVHLLRDALTLRKNEYTLEEVYARSHAEKWAKFWKARRAVETSCKRIWKAVYSQAPGKPPERWWKRVARQQGLLHESDS
jgi:hypothetical protein